MAAKKKQQERGRGRPRTSVIRLVAGLARDLRATVGDERLTKLNAATVAWQTLHEVYPRQVRGALPPEAIVQYMKPAYEKRGRTFYSPIIWRKALSLLPARCRPSPGRIARAYPPHSSPPRIAFLYPP
jgi:hypothetical protein